MKTTLLWTGFAAYLALIFGANRVFNFGGCGPPSVENALVANKLTLYLCTQSNLWGFDFGQGSLGEQKRRLEEELLDLSAKIFHYHAQLQLELYPDGLLEVWLEYPPNERLAGQNLGDRLVWEVDFLRGRILTEPSPPK